MNLQITIPQSWADVRYEQYISFYNAIKPWIDTDQYQVKLIEYAAFHFCDVSPEILYKLPDDVLLKVTNNITSFIGKGFDQIQLVKSFTIGGTEYGFLPALDEMSYGEYLDLVNYSKDVLINAPIVMSILYRPITKSFGKSYLIADYAGTNDDRIQLYKHALTMDVVFGAIGFFLGLQKDLLSCTLTYTMDQLKKIQDPDVQALHQALTRSGVDITQLQSSQITTLLSSIKLPN
jgi:hypothetical protein